MAHSQKSLKDFGYEEIKAIGRGQYGLVHLVRHIKEQNLYVCKTIDLTCLSERERQTAKQEVELLRRLDHANIVEYKESFFMGNAIVIAMQYCEGGDLATYIKETARRRTRIREAQIMQWFVQVLQALQYVHDEKILHRDLKASNLFLTERATIVKIGDFGISRVFANTADLAVSVVGTPHYMSPEVCENKPYTFKSDVWSLGCVLYELCMLKHTFIADNLLGLVHKIVSGKYESIPPMYSAQLNSLIQRMLTKNQATRPSVRNLLDDRHVQSFLTSGARSQDTVSPSPSGDRKSSWRGGLTAARGRGSTGTGSGSTSGANPAGNKATASNNTKARNRRQPSQNKQIPKEAGPQNSSDALKMEANAGSRVRAPTEAWPLHAADHRGIQIQASDQLKEEDFVSGEEYYEDDFCSDDDDSDLSDWQPDSLRNSTPEVGEVGAALSTVREELTSFATVRGEDARLRKPEADRETPEPARVDSDIGDMAADARVDSDIGDMAAESIRLPATNELHDQGKMVMRHTVHTGGNSTAAVCKASTRSVAVSHGSTMVQHSPSASMLAPAKTTSGGPAWAARQGAPRIRGLGVPSQGLHLTSSHSTSALIRGRAGAGSLSPSPKSRMW